MVTKRILLILLSAVASACPNPNTTLVGANTWSHLSDTLSYLCATTGGLVTPAPYHNYSSLYDAIQTAPCVLLHHGAHMPSISFATAM